MGPLSGHSSNFFRDFLTQITLLLPPLRQLGFQIPDDSNSEDLPAVQTLRLNRSVHSGVFQNFFELICKQHVVITYKVLHSFEEAIFVINQITSNLTHQLSVHLTVYLSDLHLLRTAF